MLLVAFTSIIGRGWCCSFWYYDQQK